MHDFKIVATKEKNGIYYCAVPHQWEHDHTLRWPEHLTYSLRETLRSDPANLPENTWAEYPCILKCSGIAKFKEALQLEKQLSGCVDTDAEEALFHSMMEKKQKKKRTTELTDRNDLFENITFHRKHNVDKSIQEEKKIKIISQEIITPSDEQDIFTRNNNVMPKVLCNSNNNDNDPQCLSTLLVHEDGSVTNYSLEDDFINPVEQQSVEIQQIKLEITNIKTEIVDIKEIIKQDFHKINVNLDRIYKMLAELNVPTNKTEISHIQKEDLLQDFNFPLSSCEEIQRLENTIRSNEEFKAQMISFLSKIGGTTREEDGVKVAYKVVDQVFKPNVLINYTWTGVSRGNKTKKKSFQILEGILNVFFEVLSLADNRHTKQRNCHIFKDCILKYATKRSLRKRSKHCDNTEQPGTSNEINDDTVCAENVEAVKDNADDFTQNEADAEDSD